MFESVVIRLRRGFGNAFAAALVASLALATSVSAQTTVVLNQAGSQVTDTTIQSGSSSNTNFDGGVLITRRSDDPDWQRRAILKFDTQNFIPQGAQIASATLTLTVKSGLGSSGETRPLRAWRIASAFQEAEATWMTRQGTSHWTSPGGDLGDVAGSANASNVAGAKVNINVTALVQNTSDGDFGSRYTRVMLADVGADAKESYREYYSSEDSTVSRRPTLTVVLGSSSTGSTPPPPTSSTTSGSTLKVMQWNIAQGYGPDGKSNIDRVAAFIAAKKPDVVSFNEIMRYSSSSQPQMIADKLRALTGQTWTYKWVQKSGASSGEGECVMTRLAIDGTDDFLLSASRSVAMISLNVNGRNVNVFSTHLDHQASSTRLAQVRQLVPWLATNAEQRIVAGDFNGWPGTPEINEMAKSYKDGWLIAKSKGVAVSYEGNPDGNTRNTRIDYVWYSENASYLSVTRSEVFYTKGSISDHNALMTTFHVN
jgi:endonuclease/exonuclease/phosphatase family metal-dependent hydrolase